MQEHVRFRALVSSGLCVSVFLPATADRHRQTAQMCSCLAKSPQKPQTRPEATFWAQKNRKKGIFGWRATETSRFGAKNPPENGERPRSALLSTKIALKIPSRQKKMQKERNSTKMNIKKRRDPSRPRNQTPRPAETHRDPPRPTETRRDQ